MNATELRRILLQAFLVFLGLTALVAIGSVLSGDIGELQFKILITTFSISAASICAMSCAAFMGSRGPAPVGIAGMALAVLSAVLLILGLWGEIRDDVFWKTMITCGVFAVSFAHALLLLLPELDARHRWLQWASAGTIGLLAIQIAGALWGEIDESSYYRVLTVVAIVVGLETLVIPIMMKLRRRNGGSRLRLVLTNVEGDVFADPSGRRFVVTEIGAGPADPSADSPIS